MLRLPLSTGDPIKGLAERIVEISSEQVEIDYTPVFATGPGRDPGTFLYDTVCTVAGCGTEFTFISDEDEIIVSDLRMCTKCARSRGDHAVQHCCVCGVQYRSSESYDFTCSGVCAQIEDEQAERAHEAELERERVYLESM